MSKSVLRDALVVALTLVTGMTDAIGIVRLGGVFTSVMTGNMVLVGIAAAKHDGSVAIHTLVAFCGYVVGTLLGAFVAKRVASVDKLWPRVMTWCLSLEVGLFAIFVVAWESTSGHPSAHLGLVLLGTNAAALGVQSAAVIKLGVTGLSTTYLTGTLTHVVARFGERQPIKGSERAIAILCALVLGAIIGALAALHAPVVAPLIPEAILLVVIYVGHRIVNEADAGRRSFAS